MKKNLLLLILLLQILVLSTGFKSSSASDDSPQKLMVPPGCVTNSSISLLWDKPENTVPDVKYILYKDEIVVDTVGVTNYLVCGLNPSQSYEFYLWVMYPNGQLSKKSNKVKQSTKKNRNCFQYYRLRCSR